MGDHQMGNSNYFTKSSPEKSSAMMMNSTGSVINPKINDLLQNSDKDGTGPYNQLGPIDPIEMKKKENQMVAEVK